MTSPIETLEMLKNLLDKELITKDEYDSRRSQVLDDLAPAPATAQFTLRGISELTVQVDASAWQDGPLEGAPNYYKVRVPSGGSAKVTTRIEALETPRSRPSYYTLLMKLSRLAADGHVPPDHTYEGANDSCALCVALRELAADNPSPS